MSQHSIQSFHPVTKTPPMILSTDSIVQPHSVESEGCTRVLLVDSDTQRSAQLILHLSRTATDLSVTCVSNGSDALAAAGETLFHCAVVQQAHPGDDGALLLNMLRNKNDQTLLPVVLVAPGGSSRDAVAAIRSGAADYLSEPLLDAETLGSVVGQVVERAQLLATLNDRLRRLQQDNVELRRRCAAMSDERNQVAHTLLTPLASIQEFISLVMDGVGGAVPERQGRFLAMARGGCLQLCKAVEAFLDPSERQLVQTVELESIEFEPWLDEVLDIFMLQAAHRGVHFGCVVGSKLERVTVDEYLLREVLLFLIPKLLDACARGDTVSVYAEADPVDDLLVNMSLRASLGSLSAGVTVRFDGAIESMVTHAQKQEICFGEPGAGQVVVQKIFDGDINYRFAIPQRPKVEL